MIKVTLPWPNKVLSPNARAHWRKKHKANVLSKTDTAWALAPWRTEKITTERAKVTMVFHPPDKRRRDLDNLIAAMKGATDGISSAIGIDDSKFELSYSMGSVEPPGSVYVTIEPL
jgi:crossover junction endodeoxyribonuclease RusA